MSFIIGVIVALFLKWGYELSGFEYLVTYGIIIISIELCEIKEKIISNNHEVNYE